MINNNLFTLLFAVLAFVQFAALTNGENQCFDKLCKLSQPEQKYNPAHLAKYKHFFNIDQPIGSNLKNRNDQDRYIDLCDEEEIKFKPNFGISVQNKNLTIVNMKGFQQEIIIRKCVNANAACNVIGDGQLTNYNTLCIQGFITRMFVVYDPSISDDEKERFSISEIKYESCCQCTAFDKKT